MNAELVLDIIDNEIMNYQKQAKKYEHIKSIIGSYLVNPKKNILMESYINFITKGNMKKINGADLYDLYAYYEKLISDTNGSIRKEELEREFVLNYIKNKEDYFSLRKRYDYDE